VDRRETLGELLSLLSRLGQLTTVVLPTHPRLVNAIKEFGFEAELKALPNLVLLQPVGYLECLKLMENATVVITDSGGIQEETTYLRVPCLTLRENTERPITIRMGTNELLPLDAERVLERVVRIFAGDVRPGSTPPLWDGHAAERIVSVLSAWLENRRVRLTELPEAVSA
jgi:UDP-N-acetylglucosamine 2-epimerase (non-hydrolysing)